MFFSLELTVIFINNVSTKTSGHRLHARNYSVKQPTTFPSLTSLGSDLAFGLIPEYYQIITQNKSYILISLVNSPLKLKVKSVSYYSVLWL